MSRTLFPRMWRIAGLFALFILFLDLGWARRATMDWPSYQDSPSTGKSSVVSLRDFTKEEVKSVGFTLTKPVTFSISAVGGGDRDVWDDEENPNGVRESNMYAAGWIINADTRQVVWEMNRDNTSGTSTKRSIHSDLKLIPGSYEVYFAAVGFARHSTFSNYSANIDRRERSRDRKRRDVEEFFKDLFGVGNEFYDDFMELAANDWGITVTMDGNDRSAVTTFSAPMVNPKAVLSATGCGDNAVVRKTIVVSRDIDIHLYALGEVREHDELFDYGWITNAETRARVWQMDEGNCRYAGGGRKNICFDGNLHLPEGIYEVTYVTDGSHSREDWNAMPPYDPFNYGITITVPNANDRKSIVLQEPDDIDKNAIVSIIKVGDDDFQSAGFSLKSRTQIQIYAIGESSGDDKMADFGWIENAKTHDRVWSMDERESHHAGGASKNRIVDEIVTLSAGDYVADHQTDGSHSFDDWNDDAPYDPTHWGLTIRGVGKGFDPKSVKSFTEGADDGALVQIIRVRDDRHERKKFILDSRTNIRIYALGESSGGEMADYGWIKNVKTGETVWEMTPRATTNAGGAHKNRLAEQTIVLEKGEYELHYQTDDTHAFGDWNDDPPRDQTHWGITLYKEN